MGSSPPYRNLRVTVLAGGVGGARMARALAAVLPVERLTVVVNIGDDDDVYGVRVCADLDSVLHTLAGIEGPDGWGIAGDTFTVMDHLAALGADTTFRLGDRDLAGCLLRTSMLRAGRTLSEATAVLRRAVGVGVDVLPASDHDLRTRIKTASGQWLSFQEYFVHRGHRDTVSEVVFEGSTTSIPAPGAAEAIRDADVLIIAPSNPILSIWPTLAIPAIRRLVRDHARVLAVSPLFAGRALKGPTAELLESHGFTPGNAGILQAYEGLLSDLVIDTGDAADAASLRRHGIAVHVEDTDMTGPDRGSRFAHRLMAAVVGGKR